MTLTTLSGWRDFANLPTADPATIPATNAKARVAYHSRFVIVRTPEIKDLITTGSNLIDENSCAIGSRRGLAVSGPPNVGKTTALPQFGGAFEVHNSKEDDPREIPVVYVSLGPRTSGKRLSIQLARFLGLPVKDRDSIDDVSHAVTTTMRNAGTALVLVDEAHHLEYGNKAAHEASDHLKHLADHSGATFVVAGINLENTKLFTGRRSNQTAFRYRVINLPVYANTTKAQRAAWRNIVGGLEKGLALHNHEAGTLVGLADYLHDRSGGYLGSLFTLVRTGAITAIKNGQELIDRNVLDGLIADLGAESQRPKRESNPPAKRPAEKAKAEERPTATTNPTRRPLDRHAIATRRHPSPRRTCSPSPSPHRQPARTAPAQALSGTRPPAGQPRRLAGRPTLLSQHRTPWPPVERALRRTREAHPRSGYE